MQGTNALWHIPRKSSLVFFYVFTSLVKERTPRLWSRTKENLAMALAFQKNLKGFGEIEAHLKGFIMQEIPYIDTKK